MSNQSQTSPELSFEYFPPRSAGAMSELLKCHDNLAKFQPDFVSVTCGAAGSTQQGTLDAVRQLGAQGTNVAPHLTCIGSSKQHIDSSLSEYLSLGVNHLVVLRGDLPKEQAIEGDFQYASDLVSYIKNTHGDAFHIEVAAYPDFHPESVSPNKDMEYFKLKVNSGADSAITQYFYNADSYFSYLDDVQRLGINVPITPGIMPITNFATLVRFSDGCGAPIPNWIRARLAQYQNDPDSLRSFGFDVVTNLCMDLLDNGVHGLHFYSLNKSQQIMPICTALGFQSSN